MSDVTDLKAEVLLLRQENAELRDEIMLNPLECALSEAQALRGQVVALQAENAELRNENKELRADQAHWELGNCPSCPNIADLQEALEQNAKLRKLMYEHTHIYAIQNMTKNELRITATNVMEDNSKLRELAVLNWEWAHSCCGNNCKMQTEGCGYGIDRECNYEREIHDRMRELGIEEKETKDGVEA